jgi:hypothetical protein
MSAVAQVLVWSPLPDRRRYMNRNTLVLQAAVSYLRILILIFFGSTAPIWAWAYLHETLHFTSVF